MRQTAVQGSTGHDYRRSCSALRATQFRLVVLELIGTLPRAAASESCPVHNFTFVGNTRAQALVITFAIITSAGMVKK